RRGADAVPRPCRRGGACGRWSADARADRGGRNARRRWSGGAGRHSCIGRIPRASRAGQRAARVDAGSRTGVTKVAAPFAIGMPPDRVFSALIDPAILQRSIPGCEELKAIGPDLYQLTLKVGVAG